jgi:hypothetical protein
MAKGGSYPSMPGNDTAPIIDQDRIAEAKPLYALRDLAYLLLGVGPRIVRVGPERLDRKHLHFEGGNDGGVTGALTGI